MMNLFFNWHNYLIVNSAIFFSYPLARLTVKLPVLHSRLSQHQKLRFARFCFILALTSFLLMPFIKALLPDAQTNFELDPILHHASASFLRHHQTVATGISSVNTIPVQLSLSTILTWLWIAGFLFFSAKFIYAMHTLKKLQKNACCRHKIYNTHILFTQSTDTPLCWSLFNKRFVVIPNTLLENKEDLRLAIRHELQHLRQGDTHWLHFMMLIKTCCFWNPFLKLWMNWFNELQEFSCDEAIILRRDTSPSVYAQCLINAARHAVNEGFLTNGVLAINGMSKSILYRRVNMLFNYKNQKRKIATIAAYAISFCAITSAAFALNTASSSAPLSTKEVIAIIKQSNLNQDLQVSATPEVVAEINKIRSDKKLRDLTLSGLERMKEYKPYIQQELKHNAMPNDLIAIPLVESGFRPLDASANFMSAAGIWQIIPSTATNLGLVINKQRDDRLDTQLSTKAALSFLNNLYAQFHDWRLAALSYEMGENAVTKLINETGSRDAWTLVRSPSMPQNAKKEVTDYLATLDAYIIILHNPKLITG